MRIDINSDYTARIPTVEKVSPAKGEGTISFAEALLNAGKRAKSARGVSLREDPRNAIHEESEGEDKFCSFCGSMIAEDGSCPLCGTPLFLSGDPGGGAATVSVARSVEGESEAPVI
ncbi:MAG: hypothetical protein NC084_01650 [Bacteroides sp.]|nr:hypothetical protein [Eubacterium sp.]MCM1419253.1 hypothetical protein [Roseburia sp.]MCM1461398.1 hypothetical protein [Bacteroides sp.]